MIYKKLILCAAIILITGCQGSSSYKNLIPAYLTIAVGKSLTLHHDLIIEANLARVYFQNGDLKPENNIDQYYPNCSLEINTLSDKKQTILADKFSIIRITNMTETHLNKIWQYASMDMGTGRPSDENWVTAFYLKSDKQPDVLRLNCGNWEDPYNPRHVTYDEIKNVLGEHITFNL